MTANDILTDTSELLAIELRELARRVGVSPKTLERRCKKMGVPVSRQLGKPLIRMDYVRNQLWQILGDDAPPEPIADDSELMTANPARLRRAREILQDARQQRKTRGAS